MGHDRRVRGLFADAARVRLRAPLRGHDAFARPPGVVAALDDGVANVLVLVLHAHLALVGRRVCAVRRRELVLVIDAEHLDRHDPAVLGLVALQVLHARGLVPSARVGGKPLGVRIGVGALPQVARVRGREKVLELLQRFGVHLAEHRLALDLVALVDRLHERRVLLVLCGQRHQLPQRVAHRRALRRVRAVGRDVAVAVQLRHDPVGQLLGARQHRRVVDAGRRRRTRSPRRRRSPAGAAPPAGGAPPPAPLPPPPPLPPPLPPPASRSP